MQVVYHPRCRPSGRLLEQALIHIDTPWVLNWGKGYDSQPNLINNAEKVRVAYDKKQALLTMRDAGNVSMPHIASNAEEAFRMVSEGKRIVGRTDHHRSGSGLFICRNTADVTQSVSRGATHWLEFVDVAKEFRVHVFDGKVIKTSEKIGGRGEIRTHRNGWTFRNPTVSFEERQPLRKQARRAVKALGLDFGAVDVGLTSDGIAYVFEVNTAPGLTSQTSSTIRHYVDAIERFVNDHNPNERPQMPEPEPEPVHVPTREEIARQLLLDNPHLCSFITN